MTEFFKGSLLGIGSTRASFQSVGSTPVVKDKLKNFVRLGAMEGAVIFSILDAMPSGPWINIVKNVKGRKGSGTQSRVLAIKASKKEVIKEHRFSKAGISSNHAIRESDCSDISFAV